MSLSTNTDDMFSGYIRDLEDDQKVLIERFNTYERLIKPLTAVMALLGQRIQVGERVIATLKKEESGKK